MKDSLAKALQWLPHFRYEHLRYEHFFRLSIVSKIISNVRSDVPFDDWIPKTWLILGIWQKRLCYSHATAGTFILNLLYNNISLLTDLRISFIIPPIFIVYPEWERRKTMSLLYGWVTVTLMLRTLSFSVVYDWQLRRRLAHCHDLAAHYSDWYGIGNMCRPSYPRWILLPMDHKAVKPRRQDRIAVGASRCHIILTHVLQTLLNMQVRYGQW